MREYPCDNLRCFVRAISVGYFDVKTVEWGVMVSAPPILREPPIRNLPLAGPRGIDREIVLDGLSPFWDLAKLSHQVL